jgi:hypothetical protein
VFIGEAQMGGAFLVHTKRVGGDDGKPIDIRAVEIRHIDGRHDITGQYATKTALEWHALLTQGDHEEVLMEDGLGFLFRQYVEKLFLFHQ